jgi:hypothetical protein
MRTIAGIQVTHSLSQLKQINKQLNYIGGKIREYDQSLFPLNANRYAFEVETLIVQIDACSRNIQYVNGGS